MDNFTRRGLNSDLRALKMKIQEVEERLNEEDEDEEHEVLGIKRIEVASDRDFRTFYTISRIVTLKWHCTCPDARYRAPGDCKHIQRAQLMPLDRFE